LTFNLLFAWSYAADLGLRMQAGCTSKLLLSAVLKHEEKSLFDDKAKGRILSFGAADQKYIDVCAFGRA
jgi:hypothetical protein